MESRLSSIATPDEQEMNPTSKNHAATKIYQLIPALSRVRQIASR